MSDRTRYRVLGIWPSKPYLTISTWMITDREDAADSAAFSVVAAKIIAKLLTMEKVEINSSKNQLELAPTDHSLTPTHTHTCMTKASTHTKTSKPHG